MTGFLGCVLKFCKIRENEVGTFAAMDGPKLTLSAVKIIPFSSLSPRTSGRIAVRLCRAREGQRPHGYFHNVQEKIKGPQSASVLLKLGVCDFCL